ncbi:MAG: DEAD/DEAH box helicase domain-containing protein [Planctomycetota bacterium]
MKPSPDDKQPSLTRAVQGGARRKRSRAGGVDAIVERLREDPRWQGQILHWHRVEARPPRMTAFPDSLDPRLVAALKERGVHELYEHQARAIDLALSGRDVLVATPTASGKTVCFTAPVIQSLLQSEGRSRALFLYPTKALSQDQTSSLSGLIQAVQAQGGGADWHAYTYDGDTPPAIRRTLRDRGHIILTNPWMLHQGILPNHAKWAELFRDLEYVVVDELHTLSGVFGSSVANVLRRLMRIARHYGSSPRFLASSATLYEAGAFAERLFGRKVELVDEDASGTGTRTFGVYQPPILDPVAGLRANALEEARELSRVVCGPKHQTIFFCSRRTAVEVLTRYLKENAGSMGLKPEEVVGYRGGYLPLLRREIESGLRDSSIKVVVSTNALELGVDVGALDVAVLVGYPGSQTSFWQRAGRVGRRASSSLVIQIARSEPVDQYLALNPQFLFAAPRERLGLDPDNLVLLSEQLKCAAFELPFHADEAGELVGEPEFGRAPHAADVLDYLAEESGFLLRKEQTWYWMTDSYPAQDVSLAGGEADNVLVLELDPQHAEGEGERFAPRQASQRAIGEVDREAAITSVYEGAIYQVQGETWRIERFDYENRRAWARRVDSDYFTDAQTDTEVRVLRLERHSTRSRDVAPVKNPWRPTVSGSMPASAPPADNDRSLASSASEQVITHGARLGANPEEEDYSIWSGEVHVTTVATQYKKIRFYTRENLGAGDIHLPAEELDTEAFLLTISDACATDLGLVGGDRGSAWRAFGQLLRRVAPLFVRCQPSDLGISTQVRSPHFERPTVFLYDRVQGGVGLSELCFQTHRDLLEAALAVIEGCDCESGCPACVGPRAEVGPLGKETVARILEHLLMGPAPVQSEGFEQPLSIEDEDAG